jgi:NodT family efflux transporter outer membrane factor (OMF) lipoprotein
VLSLQSQVASTEATLPPLEEKIDQAASLLAALSGMTPANWKQPALRLSDLRLPEDLPLTLPSQLVRQRSDVLIAEAQLHAANANIGVATSEMLPNLTLSAGFGVNSTTVGNLFASGSPFWSIGAGLTQPIFHGGALYYQRKAAVDARDAAAAEYRQTVLGAFEQVADALRGLSHDADALSAQTEAVETAGKAMRLIQANYQAGIGTYLQVLIADGQYLQAKVGYVQAIAQRLQDTVALYVALGGGWWNAPAASHG